MPGINGNTKLLIHGNNGFIDVLGHTVTPNGNISTDTTKFGGAGLKFNGTNQYLEVPDSPDWDLFGDLTSTYTVDFWVKHGVINTFQYYVTQGLADTSGWALRKNNDGTLFFFLNGAGGSPTHISLNGTTILNQDQLYHIALVVKGTGATRDIGIYINGVQDAFVQNATILTFADSLRIGNFHPTGSNFPLNGTMDEIRIQKSNVFSANPNVGNTDTITVPITAHTADVNTKLLMHFDDTLIDSSIGTPKTVTLFGDTMLVAPKFGTASLCFNGNNQRLSIPDSPDWDIFTSLATNWTIDFWVKQAKTNVLQDWIGQAENPATNLLWHMAIDGSGSVGLVVADNIGIPINISGGIISDTNWHHITMSKVGADVGIYIDGIQVAYANQLSTVIPLTASLDIGSFDNGASAFLNGQMDEIRIQNSNAFTANPVVGLTDTIAVPTIEHVSDVNTKLLMHFNGNLNDEGTGDHTVSVFGDSASVQPDPKFGTGVVCFDGVNQYLNVSDSVDWDVFGFISESWTIDWFMKTSQVGNAYIVNQTQGSLNDQWAIFFSNNTLTIQLVVGGSTKINTTTVIPKTLNDNTWHHVSFVKINTEYAFYIDGIQVHYFTDIDVANFTGPLQLGQRGDNLFYYNGKLDEFRIQKSNAFSVAPLPIPFAHFKLNDNLANNTVIDTGSGLNSGTTVANTNTLSVAGKINNALNFSGTDRVNVNAFGLAIRSDLTGSIAVWLKTTSVNDHIITWASSTSDTHFAIQMISGTIRVLGQLNTPVTIAAQATTIINDGNWHHISIVQDGVLIKIYVDGVLETLSVFSGNLGLWIGASNPVNELNSFHLGGCVGFGVGNLFFNGSIDDFRYYSGVSLTDSQVVTIYNSGSGTEVASSTITVPVAQHTSDVNTKLLMHFDGNFTDSGNTVHTVTSVNNTQTLSCQFGTGCLSLDGTGDYLSLADHPGWDVFGSIPEVWTIDWWMKTTQVGTGYIVNQTQGSTNDQWAISFTGSVLNIVMVSGGVVLLNQDTTIPKVLNDGNWHHIMFIHKNIDYSFYIDGVQVLFLSSLTAQATFTGPLQIGQRGDNLFYYNGSIDEFRITNANPFGAIPNSGNTNTITVPVSEHTSSINTKLLMHFNGNLLDSSDIGQTVTSVNNSLFVEPKFGAGNGRFDGVGDYLSIPDSPSWDIMKTLTEDWTIDCWVKIGVNENVTRTVVAHFNNGIDFWRIIINTFTSALTFEWGTQILSATVFTLNAWNHVAVIKKGSDVGLYLNGIQVAFLVQTVTVDATVSLTIGQLGNNTDFFNGHIDDLRIIKSNAFAANPVVGLTDTIAVPTVAHVSDVNTHLLLPMNTNFTDSSSFAHFVSNVNNPIFSYSKFGQGAIHMDGAGDFLTVPDSTDWDMMASLVTDYTVDYWIKHKITGTNERHITQIQNASNYWIIQKETNGNIHVASLSVGVTILTMVGGNISDTEWHHVAVIKVGSNVGIYIDGIQVSFKIATGTGAFAHTLDIGESTTFPGLSLNGNMDELRIQKSNIFGANPVVGLTDTIAVSSVAYSSRSIKSQGIIIT